MCTPLLSGHCCCHVWLRVVPCAHADKPCPPLSANICKHQCRPVRQQPVPGPHACSVGTPGSPPGHRGASQDGDQEDVMVLTPAGPYPPHNPPLQAQGVHPTPSALLHTRPGHRATSTTSRRPPSIFIRQHSAVRTWDSNFKAVCRGIVCWAEQGWWG